MNPKDFVIWHDGVQYEDFDNDILIAVKKHVEGILQKAGGHENNGESEREE